MNESCSESYDIKTFVFMDTETTGLPSAENNKTKITELSMVAVQANHIRLGVFPRVQNKLNFCFNPCKLISDGAEKITGLSNHLLENLPSFSAGTVASINAFLNHNPQPVCLVAHNGNHFDFPLLHTEINKTKSSLAENILCIDSIITFQDIHFQDTRAEKISQETVPIELTDDYDLLLCSAAEQLEQQCIEKALKVQKINETTPKKQKIRTDTSEFPYPSKMRKGVRKKFRFNSGISFKLCDVYTRLTNRPPENLHQAEGDVLMLITCAATLGDKFVDWANLNARKFCDIPAMVPGKKIGT
nr:three prime repair exonuclease 2-like [Leptinotarsa decemlineata]